MKILIVDDNPDSRIILANMLKSAGHEVETAIHGEDALQKARLSIPELIVSDILMPVLDGFKFCYEVKNDPKLKAVPFVFYTATYIDPNDERLAMGLGASRYIIKPMENEEFLRIIDEIVQETRKGKLSVPEKPVDKPADLFRNYDQSLSRKLDKKVKEMELYRKVFENAAEAIAIINTDGIIIKQNPAQYRMLGYSDDDLRGRTPAVYLGDELFSEALKQCKLAGVVSGEEVAFAQSGRQSVVEYSIFPVNDETGFAIAYVVMLRDLTKRREAEKKQKLFRTLLDYSNDAIFVINPATSHFMDVNEQACRRLGYQREELLTKGVIDIDPVFNTAEKWHAHVANLRKKKSLIVESKHLTRKGVSFPVEVSVVLTGIDIQEFMLAIVRDITERKDAEEKLRRIQEEWDKTFDAVSDIVTLMDTDMKIIRPNRAMCETFKITAEEAIGRHCYEIFRGIEEPCPECPILTSISSFSPCTKIIEHPDLGKTFQVTAVPVLDDSGSIEGIAHFARDITEQRKLESQLLQAQKMEAVGMLAGGIAHDFNNILTAIIGYASLLKMDMSPDNPNIVNAENILASAERAAQLTRGLLAFSRKQVMNPQILDMNEIVRGIEKLLFRLIGEDITLKTALADGTLLVFVDKGQIEQVLMNLATNARDAMPKGGNLTIKTEGIYLDEDFIRLHGYEGESGKYALITVSDTGVGMDEKTRLRIFEPFFTTKALGRGTGLGLSMVYGIIKQHGGFINCYSEVGKGTTFRIYIPLSRREAEKRFDEKETSADDLPHGTESILVAEDDLSLRDLISTILKTFGYQVIESVDGEDAVSKFNENKDSVKLVMLDMIMPKMNGKDALRQIRKVSPGIKALFLSGYPADVIQKENISELGAELIIKPVSPRNLLKKVRDILDR